MTIYDKTKELLEEKGLSINKFELESGIGRGTFSKWATSSPSVDKVIKAAAYLSVSVDYLTGGQTETPAAQGDGLDVYRDIISGLCGNDQEKLRLLQDALSKNPEKTKASFDLFLKTL